MRPLKNQISITIDSDILEKIKIESENDCRSVSQFINLVMRDYFKNKEEQEKAPRG